MVKSVKQILFVIFLDLPYLNMMSFVNKPEYKAVYGNKSLCGPKTGIC